ncbi:MAG: amidase [Bradyrhizobium sp.]|jgi:amidase|nr:amidase [Bradyrhizobium sp.]
MYSVEEIRRLAFVEHGPSSLRLMKDGPLVDLSFAAKDLIDIAGYKSAWGNPDRLRDADPAVTTAPAALVPLVAGAHLIGKTHTDEIACGMFGMNPHFGTPINPKAPTRVPGGSSSGSASAVAANFCDFALGTDTGGSIRVPASFCGLYGLRTTYGRLSVAGIMAMAPSFDAVGWLARDATTLKRVGEICFGPIGEFRSVRLMLARDAFDIPVRHIGEALLPVARSLGSMTELTLFAEGVEYWLETFRPLQLYDLWSTLGAWGKVPGRTLSPAVAERIELSSHVDSTKFASAVIRRESLTDRLATLLGSDGVLVLPTAHDLPPLRDAPVSAQIEFREKTLALTCVASLCRLPQINIPAVIVDGCPVGLSFIAGPRGDQLLLDLAEKIGNALPVASLAR